MNCFRPGYESPYSKKNVESKVPLNRLIKDSLVNRSSKRRIEAERKREAARKRKKQREMAEREELNQKKRDRARRMREIRADNMKKSQKKVKRPKWVKKKKKRKGPKKIYESEVIEIERQPSQESLRPESVERTQEGGGEIEDVIIPEELTRPIKPEDLLDDVNVEVSARR